MDNMKKLEDFNLDEMSELDLQGLDLESPNMEEVLYSMGQNLTESIARTAIEEISLQQLADILEISKHTIAANYAGMLINTFEHPTIGGATTIQASGNGALLIKHLPI